MGSTCERCKVIQNERVEIIQVDIPGRGGCVWCADCISQELQAFQDDKVALLTELIELAQMGIRALCLTRDYVGADTLPAIDGWEWYDACLNFEALEPTTEWADEFRQRCKLNHKTELLAQMRPGE